MVETRIANTNSPWLAGVQVGDIHAIPVSHGEGKFVVTAEEFAELRDNGQIWSHTLDFDGQPSMDSKYNPNGSLYAIEGITSKNGQIIGKMVTQNVTKMVFSKIFQVRKTRNCLKVPFVISKRVKITLACKRK